MRKAASTREKNSSSVPVSIGRPARRSLGLDCCRPVFAGQAHLWIVLIATFYHQQERTKIMRRIIPTVAFAMAVSTAAFAQQPAPMTSGPAQIFTALPAGTTVTNFYKQNVYDPSDNKISDVDDVLIDKEGHVTAMIIGVGGFLGMAEKDVAIPFSALHASEKNNKQVVSGPEHDQGRAEVRPWIHVRQDQNHVGVCCQITIICGAGRTVANQWFFPPRPSQPDRMSSALTGRPSGGAVL
jgi:PRC-barrel domain